MEKFQKMFLIDDTYNENTFKQLDPTVIIRLHSILSQKDIFTLSNLVDYSVTYESEKLLSLKLPTEILRELQNLNLNETYFVAEKWCSSKEVKLYNWTMDKCYSELLALLELANHNKSDAKIYIQIAPDTGQEIKFNAQEHFALSS